MSDIRIISDLEACQTIWQAVMPAEVVTDLWEVRECFQHHYGCRPHFIISEDEGRINGLLPLSQIPESRCYGYFPGETWKGMTWLEQNRIYAVGNMTPDALLRHCPPGYDLRYLLPDSIAGIPLAEVDEVGYLFLPGRYGYDMQNYFQEFSRKSAKQILREVATMEKKGVTYRYDDPADFDLMVNMNIGRFGACSYFYDPRFRESFRDMARLFHERGWLRMTTVLIGGEPAAVDMGCLYGDVLTVMAGGTNGAYPGVAKLINLHHLQRACDERLGQVDFLCGDFTWKKLFHLTPRPLFRISHLIPDNAPVPEPLLPVPLGAVHA